MSRRSAPQESIRSAHQSPSIAVIGGGAAGYFAAITAAEAKPAASVHIFEQSRRVLAKVAISGGGRCNVTHHCFEPKELARFYPRGSRELRGAFFHWQPQDTIDWFESRGVKLKTEADGRMFPTTDDSQTIIDCLQKAADRAGVSLHLKTGVSNVARQDDDSFRLELTNGKTVEANRLILATGGGKNNIGHRIASGLGNRITELAPSLFTFNIQDPLLTDLAGLSLPRVSVTHSDSKLQQTGPVLVTHWGLSGPGILKLSAWGARTFQQLDYRFRIVVNWLGDSNPESARDALEEAKRLHARKALASVNPFDFPKRFWERLLEVSSLPSHTQWAQLPKKGLNQLVERITRSELQVDGKSTNKEEFVTCGGVDLRDVDFKTMQSKHCPGLHFAGEALDIDGVTGGFNFQAAWTTGRIAGQAAAEH
ncbi:NAD(P)/FAD-dependent oxidoreductase [Pelagicoccus sp. SDUM812003]|uniref:NAD(P)/FAD-dependent oxidoreductase n=1 Tax=Pelagicoccus sp. SDUM812003 TaxID=3041267 RepID=UPI00280E628D|nr:NAD(P)/FAD-dependent oxidoreductase [Pelagicoccus sp. SDUM812003]MDQ8203542.1 NAD(P)/FAD-dependent oxidoreductase [Pelagicoccus sp. SDUM812003]